MWKKSLFTDEFLCFLYLCFGLHCTLQMYFFLEPSRNVFCWPIKAPLWYISTDVHPDGKEESRKFNSTQRTFPSCLKGRISKPGYFLPAAMQTWHPLLSSHCWRLTCKLKCLSTTALAIYFFLKNPKFKISSCLLNMTKHLHFPECFGNPVYPSTKPHIYFEGVIPAALNDAVCILKYFGEPGPFIRANEWYYLNH